MKQSTLDNLKKSQIEFMFESKDFLKALRETADDIIKEATPAKNEATVASIFETSLYVLIRDLFRMNFHPNKEEKVNIVRHVASGKKDVNGRIDSRIGALIIEFKHKDSLRAGKNQQDAVVQLTDYLISLQKQSPCEYVGFITDGIKATFITVDKTGSLSGNPAFENLSEKHLEKILKIIVLLDKSAFTPENLIKDFCTPDGDSISNRLIHAFYNALEKNITSRSQMLFNEWKELFKLAHDDFSKQKPIEERRQALSNILGKQIIDNETEYQVLYALQTAYAVIIKIIAYKIMGRVRFHNDFIKFSDLSIASSDVLRSQLSLLEEGAIFRSMGIGNLLEGDFFAWYCTENQWTLEVAEAIKEVFSVLKDYEDAKLFSEDREIQDLFKDLYLHIMPAKVRHSLGEYYTPEWLADNLVSGAIEKLGTDSKWKALDPCSGSGTFIIVLIKKVLEGNISMPKNERLQDVLARVKALDLNPLAVLTTRINYFINVAFLISNDDEFEIPVYLGDSSYVPEPVSVDGVDCLSYQIKTLRGYIDLLLPKSSVENPQLFSKTMTSIEMDITNRDSQSITRKLNKLTAEKDKTQKVLAAIEQLATKFIELEQNDWNGIWARIVTNFLTTANIGRFDLIVGNPPWIDWKNLPAGYRERIKMLCVDRKLFSGDSITGGINLNVCALIANVAAENWLKPRGILSFLMPENLIFQQSYEGFRNFYIGDAGQNRLFLQELYDWTKSGHPFHPVQYPFLTFYYSARVQDYSQGIPVKRYIKKFGNDKSLYDYRNKTLFAEVVDLFEIEQGLAGAITLDKNMFTFAETREELIKFGKIAGISEYIGRDGIDFYPQELFLLNFVSSNSPKGTVLVSNHQNTKARHKLAQRTFPLETKILFPLIRSLEISRFHIASPKFFVPFPYEDQERAPISRGNLANQAPQLMKYFNDNRYLFNAKTTYNAKIIGEKYQNEYYAIARVGKYSFADICVAFRKDTKWVAAVVEKVETPWGEMKMPKFLSHAVTLSERSDGSFIGHDEAYYICAILNAPTVEKYIYKSSDMRSFKVRPPLKIPLFNSANKVHEELASLSIEAHLSYSDEMVLADINQRIDELILLL